MPTRTAAAVAAALALLSVAGCGEGAKEVASSSPSAAYEAWPVREGTGGDRVVRALLDGDDAPYVATTAATADELAGETGLDDLQNVLRRLALGDNAVDAADGSVPGRLIVWGEVEAEHGGRRFAARIDDAGEVTAFVATAADFEQLGGPAVLGGPTPAEARSRPEFARTDVPPPRYVKLNDGGYGVPGWHRKTPDAGEPQVTNLQVADPDDPLSPRRYGGSYPIEAHPDTRAAALAALAQGGIEEAELPLVAEAAEFGPMFGIGMHLGVGRGAYRGADRSLAVSVEVSKDRARTIVNVLDAPPEVMAAWGPTTAAALMTGYVDDPGVIDPAARARLLAAPLERQSLVAARLANLGGQALLNQYMGLLMNQQMSTLNTMRQFNANLMTETQAVVGGMDVSYDGLGNAQLSEKP